MMDLSPLQRRMAFAIIVVALAGLGVFLLRPGSRAASRPAGASALATAAPADSPPASAAAPAAGATAPGGSASAVDIYRLLPFTRADLGRALAVAHEFAVDYGTYSYQQDGAAYTAAMRGLVTTELAATIARGYDTAGVAEARKQQKQVSSASADVTGLRAFGSTSLTFLVRVVQSIAAVQGGSHLTTAYAITVVRLGAGWQVSDIQLASAGNS